MNKVLYISTLLIAATGCKQAYSPRPITTGGNYLVVEGIINTGQDSTIFTLSRAVNLSSKVNSIPEPGAQAVIEGADNSIYPLAEIGGGRYGAAALGLDSTKQYRIRIKTTNGKEYISDLVHAKPTPPIDSIGFNRSNNGIQVYVNTHDPKNNTWYYRWDYQETWQYHAYFYSTQIYDDTQGIRQRTPDENIYFCFGNHNSSSATVGSSAKLKQDVIYQQPVVFIESTSEKIETRYSILLRQFALTPDAYNYWQNLKKNTEQLGSIFDAQPSGISGNIHCSSDPSEPVIGYVSAGSVKQKRVYINDSQLPDSWVARYPYEGCHADSELYCAPPYCINNVVLYINSKQKIPVIPLFQNGITIGYSASTTDCVDCTIRGTTKAPAFWKY